MRDPLDTGAGRRKTSESPDLPIVYHSELVKEDGTPGKRTGVSKILSCAASISRSYGTDVQLLFRC